MDLNALLISMASMGGLGIIFSAGLSIANKKLYVEEDPRIAKIIDELPGANCGGCGYAGCANFAENVVTGKAKVNGCPVATTETVEAVAEIMGVEAGAGVRLVARVLCQGGFDEAAVKAEYLGIRSCLAAHLMGGGPKLCEYGCLGFGECVESCPFDALYMNENGLPVVLEEKCTGCGNCAEVCPRGVIEIHPVNHRLFVMCKNEDGPKDAQQCCTVACIGCGLCAKCVEDGQIAMENNLAKINYDLFGSEAILPTDKCRTKAMVIIDENGSIIKSMEEIQN